MLKRKSTTRTGRRRLRDRIGPALALAAFAACSGGAERAILDQFFTASRLRDFNALEKVSTVIFEPRQDGTVLSYDIEVIRETSRDSEEVLINATVHLPSGKTEQRPLLVSLRRLKDRWMVSSVKVSTESASPESPPR